jgi:hypothetical protein
MSRRMIAVTVGILFVLQMVTAMLGSTRIQTFVDGGAGQAPPTTGVLLMLTSGIAVVGIGLLMYQVLKDVDRRLAWWYPALRVVELAVTVGFSAYLLAQLQVVPHHMLWLYVPTAIGGLILNYLLFVSRLVPRPIAVLGLVGYALLLLAVPLDLLAVVDTNAGPGVVLLALGGLFEAVVLPLWLISKGFRPPVPSMATEPSVLVSTN